MTRTLRANISETLLGPIITEQGEKESQRANDKQDCSRPCGFGCRGARASTPLTAAQQQAVLARLHEERFQDRSPSAVFATLLDEGQDHCSIRTMYRLLEQRGESRERRDHFTHPTYQKPELPAAAPNQLWSCDITKLMGPAKWTYFHLYVVGWMVAPRDPEGNLGLANFLDWRYYSRMRRLLCCFLLAAASAALWAQTRDFYLSNAKRKALVIGNDAYVTAPPLRNAVNDARDLGARLRQLDFEVTVVTDAGEEGMDRAVREFAGSIEPGDVAFFHFSGHGVQIEGDNYLIPVNFGETDEVGAKHHSFSATELHDRIAAKGAALKILTLDACRNNRFRSFRGGTKGLSAMSVGAEGSYLAFATAPGRVASDNPDGRNGLFTGALLEALSEQRLELDQIFRKVRATVAERSSGEHLPWTSSSVTGEFYFLPAETGAGGAGGDPSRVAGAARDAA